MGKKTLLWLAVFPLLWTLVGCGTSTSQTISESPQTKQWLSSVGNDRYVVVLSMDGFRYDYVNMTSTPALNQMADEGTWGCLRPCYPSLTFPNHYAMATGLYPNDNGLVANEFWDPTLGHYKLGNRKSVSNPAFYNGEPVWNTARRQGVHTASFYWVGSETAINGHYPDIWKSYNASVPYETRADSVIKWLQMPEAIRPHLIMWYIDQPDHIGHELGPHNPKTWAMVRRCDSVVGYFRHKLAQLPIAKKVDFIVVADHGMADYFKSKAINVADYVPTSWFYHMVGGACGQLYTKPEYLMKAYEALKKMPHCRVFLKKDLPKRLHYGSSDRIGDIVIIPDIGTYIYTRKNAHYKDAGAHGYDNANKQMFAIFRAVGPHFRKSYRVMEPIPNITIYPMICDILGIKQAKTDADNALALSLLINLDKK